MESLSGLITQAVEDSRRIDEFHLWTVDGAQAMLDLRCIHLSEAWDELTKFCVARLTQRLYPAS